MTADFLISTCAKGEFPIGLRVEAGEQDDANRSIVLRVRKGLNHFGDSVRGESIAPVRTIDRHLCNTITLLIYYFFKFTDFFPIHLRK